MASHVARPTLFNLFFQFGAVHGGLSCQGGRGLRQQILQRFGNVNAEHEHRHGGQNQRQAATEWQMEFFIGLRLDMDCSPVVPLF